MKKMENIIETNKGNVYLRRHLKEVMLFSDSHSNSLQTA
jgi:hypothetical protein